MRKPSRTVWAALLLLVLCTALLGLYYALPQDTPQVPDVDLSAMEPQVAAKITEHREAVEADPASHEAWGRLGMVLQAHGRSKEASECYRRAAELAPGEFRWQYLMAHAQRSTDPLAALALAESASEIRRDYAPVHVLRAQLLEEDNQPELAMEQYQRAVEIDPDCALAHFGLGRISLSQNQLDESLRHLLRARELSEDAPAVRASLAQVYRRLDDREAAAREARLASELDGAVGIADPIHYQMRKESVSSLAQLDRAQEAYRAGDYRRAEAIYRELVELRPHDADMHQRLGDTLAKQSKLQPAREEYRAALEINPKQASALYGLGNMFNFEGNYGEAARHYRRALEVRPEHIPTLLNLGGILVFEGNLGEAASVFRRAYGIDPTGFGPNRQLGQVLLRQRKFREAIPRLRAALKSRPDSGPVHLQLGMALAATGDFRAAWEHVQKARELGETVPPKLIEELERRIG
jgi:tetratricopeptide (TPR) repeat protein